MKKSLLFIALLFYSTFNFSQDLIKKDSLIQAFFKENIYVHKQLKEKFSVHTNKKTYYPGEKIWFKAYVVKDIDNKPYTTTTNLYVRLVSSSGETLDKKLFFCEKGSTYGELEIPDNLKGGKYYIEVNTNWNLNFKEAIYKTEIVILNTNETETANNKSSKKIKNDLKIDFYPESGILLKKRYNKIFFKATKNGIPVEVEGEIIDKLTKDKLGKVKSNSNGVGVFNVYIRANQRKKIVFKHEREDYKIDLPKAKEVGFILNKAREDEKAIIVRVKTNSKTIQKKFNDTLFVVLERKGFVRSVNPIILNKKYENYIINYPKEIFFEGINEITLFDSNKNTLAKRNFFLKKKKDIKLEVLLKKETKDSLYLDIKSLNYFKKINTSIAISFDKIEKDKRSNIMYDYLISPYISLSSKSSFHLSDKNNLNLCINSMPYSFKKGKNIFFKKNKPFEQGISLEGEASGFIIKSDNYKIDYKVVLSSMENGVFLTTKLNSDDTFRFNHIKMNHPSEFQLSLLDDKGKTVSCSFYVFKKTFDNKQFIDTLNIDNDLPVNSPSMIDSNMNILKKDIVKINDNVTAGLVDEDGNEELNEVVITGKKRVKKKKQEFIQNFEDVNKVNFKTTKVLKTRLISSNTISDIVHGIQGVVYVKSEQNVVFTGRGPNSFLGNQAALVVFNGSVLTDHSLLEEIRASELDGRIRVNKSGAGYGIRGANGVLVINTKRIKTLKKNNKSLKGSKNEIKKEPKLHKTNYGYTKPTLKYKNTMLDNESDDYKCIDWLPNFNINPNKSNILKVKKINKKRGKLIINGFTEDGELLYEIIDIPYSFLYNKFNE